MSGYFDGFGILMYCRFTWQFIEFLRWHLVPSRGAVWGTRSSMLDCHVLKGLGIYIIGILGSLY